MMEYKFRGKRVDNGEWVIGKLFFLDNPKYYSILPIGSDVYPEISADGETGRYLIEPVEVIPETIGEFTGLHDKNGVEIYEGDIVMYSYEFVADIICGSNRYETESIQCEVYEKNGAYWIQPTTRTTTGLDMDFLGEVYTDIEVIGNIHDKE